MLRCVYRRVHQSVWVTAIVSCEFLVQAMKLQSFASCVDIAGCSWHRSFPACFACSRAHTGVALSGTIVHDALLSLAVPAISASLISGSWIRAYTGTSGEPTYRLVFDNSPASAASMPPLAKAAAREAARLTPSRLHIALAIAVIQSKPSELTVPGEFAVPAAISSSE